MTTECPISMSPLLAMKAAPQTDTHPMAAQQTCITAVRVAVLVPAGVPPPDRVSVSLKEQHKFFPLRRKLATVSLRHAVWTQVADDVRRAESWHPVQINLLKLLRLAQHRCLALKVCCRRGRSDKNKFLLSFFLLFDQTQNHEFFLEICYPGAGLYQQNKPVHTAGEELLSLQTETPLLVGAVQAEDGAQRAVHPKPGSTATDNVKEACGQRQNGVACDPQPSQQTQSATEPQEGRQVRSRAGGSQETSGTNTGEPRHGAPEPHGGSDDSGLEVCVPARQGEAKGHGVIRKSTKKAKKKATQKQWELPMDEDAYLYFCMSCLAVFCTLLYEAVVALRPVLGAWVGHAWVAGLVLAAAAAGLNVWYSMRRRQRHGGRWSSPKVAEEEET